MGAISFSLDFNLVAALKSKLSLNVLVETGTFKGDTVAEFQSSFDNIISIELSESLWNDAATRFNSYPNIRILQGDSGTTLHELQQELQSLGVLYWLDAHWCVATGTAGERSQCPLLEELHAIGKLNPESAVLIDDARLFLAPPLAPHEISHWPSFHQVITFLMTMSEEHELMVINDVIAFFPRRAKAAMDAYAQINGTDWLNAANSLKQNGSFMRQLEEKEKALQAQEDAIQSQAILLQAKEKEIFRLSLLLKEQKQAIKHLENGTVPLLRPLARAARRLVLRTRDIFKPRLGNLNQYKPRPMTQFGLPPTVADLAHPPMISIVTPSFGQGSFIERTICSVLDQAYPNLEYFVQDGGSKDDTVEVLVRYKEQLTGWASEQDSGQSQAINRGLARTSGEIMAWLNSDDILLPGTLATVADFFERNPDVDVLYGDRLMIDENDMEIGRWIMPGHDCEVLTWADYVPQETMFWRRRIWEKAGGRIDESFRFAMDWDLLVRFRDAGAKFMHIPYFLAAFRIHELQKTSATINEIGHQEMDRIRERILGRVPKSTEIHKAVLPFLLKHIAVDMIYRIKQRLGQPT